MQEASLVAPTPRVSCSVYLSKSTWPLSNKLPSSRSYPDPGSPRLRNPPLWRFVIATRCRRSDFRRISVAALNGTGFASFILRPTKGWTVLGKNSQLNLEAISQRTPHNTGEVKCSERCYSPCWPWSSRRRSEPLSPSRNPRAFRHEAPRGRTFDTLSARSAQSATAFALRARRTRGALKAPRRGEC